MCLVVLIFFPQWQDNGRQVIFTHHRLIHQINQHPKCFPHHDVQNPTLNGKWPDHTAGFVGNPSPSNTIGVVLESK
jgi:hypothetical protein